MIDKIESHIERFAIAGAFTIARGSRTEAVVVRVTLKKGDHQGNGECVPYARYGETPQSVIAQIQAIAETVKNGLGHQELQKLLPQLLPPGTAHNALDCALWDLQAKISKKPVWQLADLAEPRPVTTAYTISLGTPEKMAKDAAKAKNRELLKIKLGGDDGDDIARMRAVRFAAPDAKLILDANEGWHPMQIEALLDEAKAINAALVEQPLPAGDDAILAEIRRNVPVCADESLHTVDDLKALRSRYDAINIKLDKTGGLTKAIALLNEARKYDYQIMIGCMLGTSLAMAPALLLADEADFVDLDGPLLLAEDRAHPIVYPGSKVLPPDPQLWG